MDAPHLIYFADPMCSWCWGFEPVIAAVAERYEDRLPVRLILGGLRPGTVEPMARDARAGLAAHWQEVAHASGQPFDAAPFEKREGFVYDTDPASRAVVTVRRRDPAAALAFLAAIQRAFYAEGRDVTSAEVLADLGEGFEFEREAFLADLSSEAVREETRSDYATAHDAGVRGFPTLIVGPRPDGRFVTVTRGFNTASTLFSVIDEWRRT